MHLCAIHTLLLLEMHRRLRSIEASTANRSGRGLLDDAWRQGAYCLDAPELLPGGGHEQDLFEDGEPFPCEITVEREGS